MSTKVSSRNCCIVVLGDIGRSPRMQYHAESLLENNYNVTIVGYVESKPLDSLIACENPCKIHNLPPIPATNLTTTLRLVFKTIWQALSLLIALISLKRQHFLLIQNPPGVPTLFVCYLYCFFARTKMIIDWHNYSYTILALDRPNGERNWLCRLTKWMEQYFGSKAHRHFCVTEAMKDDLERNWHFKAPITVLYDRPAAQFHEIDLPEKHAIYMKLGKDFPQLMAQANEQGNIVESNALTEKLNDGSVRYKNQRPGILVSSTSWTPDEDFGILLSALQEYENKAVSNDKSYPDLLCIITGKGPQKELYINKIKELNWRKVTVITPWLEQTDYPAVLAAADIGVCLHFSSSGLDLPMKVVDMLGSGLPVCAYNYKCLGELLQHKKNGFVFHDSYELAALIMDWFADFPNNPKARQELAKLQENIRKFQSLRWRENWNTRVAGQIF